MYGLAILLGYMLALIATQSVAQQSTECGPTLKTRLKGYILESLCAERDGEYRITNSATDSKPERRPTHLIWTSAALSTGEDFWLDPREMRSEPYHAMVFPQLVKPVYFDAADLWGISTSVTARNKFGVETGKAPAYAPPKRVIVESIVKFPSSITTILKLGEKLKLVLESNVTVTGDPARPRYVYTYRAGNFSDRSIYLKWTSVLAPDLQPASGLETRLYPTTPGRPPDAQMQEIYQRTTGAPPIQIFDIAAFTGKDSKFPPLKYLGLSDDFGERVQELSNAKPFERSYMMAPAFASRDWFK